MSVFGPEDSRTGRHPARSSAPMVEEDPRRARGDTLARGTLACPRCDAPVALPGRTPATSATRCPFCGHRDTLGGFVSLAAPTRPARVLVRVQAPARAGR